MEAKSVLYAAVGAPVVVARKMGHQVTTLKERVTEGASHYSDAAGKAFKGWAAEGEKVMARIGEGKVVEEISAKVDLDQAKEQVSKLRDQLEDMLATWRTSFRPETKKDEPSAKPKTPAAKTPAAKPATQGAKTQAKPKTSAAKTTKSSSAARTSSTKSSPTPGDDKAS